ncbi:hypothetical protein [Rhizobium phaseoli]|uniref:Catalase n=1 Tax=Rhizobium phaseoli TaxID=396 RepID=A0ABN4QNQ9_9HYPH|nr:hypothetical protein [Rhizobium phaseoli]ANL87125.1 hypothetical protein AMC81_PA00104 [Rhizobium phaseoli]ANL93634.1 hypothetical protein AMC80_PA00104 [Rhizobium phaseoli]
MSAAARPLHYFDTVHNGIAPAKTTRSASEILRGATAPAPVTKEFLHVGQVQRATERVMRQKQPLAYNRLASSVPRHVRIQPYQPNAHAHDTIEHFSFMRVGAVDTTYKGQKVRAVLSMASAECYPYFEDGKQKFRDLPKDILDDKAQQRSMYWCHLEDMNGKPVDTHFKDALVFKTTDFNTVVQKCAQMAPKPQAAVRGVLHEAAPRPSLQQRGMAYV